MPLNTPKQDTNVDQVKHSRLTGGFDDADVLFEQRLSQN